MLIDFACIHTGNINDSNVYVCQYAIYLLVILIQTIVQDNVDMDKADNLEAADISKDDGKSKSEAVERKKVRVTV